MVERLSYYLTDQRTLYILYIEPSPTRKMGRVVLCNFRRNFVLSRGKIWLWIFSTFFIGVPWFYNKKSQVILIKKEGVTAIFVILHCVCLSIMLLVPFYKMANFGQILNLWYLWKRFDKTLQSILSKFSKIKH